MWTVVAAVESSDVVRHGHAENLPPSYHWPSARHVGTEVPPHWFRGWKACSGERHPLPQRIARRHHQRHGLTHQLVQGERQGVKALHPIDSKRKNGNNNTIKLGWQNSHDVPLE